MARLEKLSMLLKIPGIMAQGDFQPSLALIQKHRGQESGRARMPRVLAEIRMNHFVDHVCEEGKGRKSREGQKNLPVPQFIDSSSATPAERRKRAI